VSTHGPRLRPDLEALPSYKAGQRPRARTDITTYKISSNESHHVPLDSVQAAIVAAVTDINRYPDPFSRELVATIAGHFEVSSEHVSLGTGSVALCGQIIASAAGPGDSILYAWRSFESYPIWTGIAGANSIQVPLKDDETHDLDAMLDALTPETRVIFICSPNNPTGQIVDRDELEKFIRQVPVEVVIVLDEAYIEYVPEEKRSDSLRLYREHCGPSQRHMVLLVYGSGFQFRRNQLLKHYAKRQCRLGFPHLLKPLRSHPSTRNLSYLSGSHP
jgi:histidinol-phosphate aminotransferase